MIVMDATGATLPENAPVDLFIAFVGEEAKHFAQKLAHDMRKQGFRVMSDIAERNVKGQFKYADRVHSRYTVVIGEEEIHSGELTMKNMETGEQTKIRMEELADRLRKDSQELQ